MITEIDDSIMYLTKPANNSSIKHSLSYRQYSSLKSTIYKPNGIRKGLFPTFKFNRNGNIIHVITGHILTQEEILNELNSTQLNST